MTIYHGVLRHPPSSISSFSQQISKYRRALRYFLRALLYLELFIPHNFNGINSIHPPRNILWLTIKIKWPIRISVTVLEKVTHSIICSFRNFPTIFDNNI
ncbi:hypothetical protein HanXRQr2_Chr09g0398841 [Helianthus annuus]|uniref:Uncharacterized protein n=1 Tax=Helianthus annuus TaxID=4232 RepID=A0A9K3I7B4_HELAN|nr:hypothetical protein HanXRQr2_Chr09g0398841 [Helianthus annuus]KAJ0894041.1 hypothetical protein HanPSC8_Chr09g0384611 [Helianthus annuus]